MAKGKKLAYDKNEKRAVQPSVVMPSQPKSGLIEKTKKDIQEHPKFDKFKKGK